MRTPIAAFVQAMAVALEDGGFEVAAVYKVCSRATTFLFKSVIVARGELDRNPLPGTN